MTDPQHAPCAALARPNGVFALLALDQRETLRSILIKAGRPSSDADVSAFKVEVARWLTPAASGLLIDPVFGFDPVRAERVVPDSCGMILAVDEFSQEPGGLVEDTRLDRKLLGQQAVDNGARAFKYMVIWRHGQGMGAQRREVQDFVEGCRRLGVASVLEGLVHPSSLPADALDDAILEAAAELGRYQPDIYKGQIPTQGKGTPVEIDRLSRQVVASLPCPWVVLSGGVPTELFPGAVEIACRAGASGFLAGRGIWGPSITAPDLIVDLQTAAGDRLERLTAIADRYARPWPTAVAAAAARDR
jgi:sulfofructosephosphate aldolase